MGRAIVRQPKVFLFDEPLSNLDAKLRVAMRVEIRKLQHRLGTTSIYVTHDQLEAMTLADILVVMNGGQVEQIGIRSSLREAGDDLRRHLHRGTADEPAVERRRVSSARQRRRSTEGAVILASGPEDFVITGRTPAGGVTLPLTVEAVERVGAGKLSSTARAQDERRSPPPRASCRPARSSSAFPEPRPAIGERIRSPRCGRSCTFSAATGGRGSRPDRFRGPDPRKTTP